MLGHPQSFWFGRLSFLSLAAATLGSTLAPAVFAEGFRNPPAGAFSLGRAGGRIAHIEEASAAAHNPANLAYLSRPEAQFSATIVAINADYTSPSGQTAETTDPWKLLPNIFAAWPFPDQNLTFGFGLTTPFGISNEWKQEGAYSAPFGQLRYTAPHFAELKTINANPTIAFKLGDHIAFGGGLDIFWGELSLRQFYPWMIFPGGVGLDPEGEVRAEGDAVGLGANLGITIDLAPRHRIALAYRSPVTLDFEGDFEISNIPARAAFFGATSRSDFSSSIEFPSIASLGYGFEVSDTVRIEADAEWVQFSNFQSLDLGIGNNAFLLPSTSIPQRWRDTFTVGIGGDWRFAEQWVGRLSYQFYQSPVPDETYSPTIPDADQNVITAGIGWHSEHHTAEFGYGAVFYDDRNITTSINPAYNGAYEVTVHLFSLTYRYSF